MDYSLPLVSCIMPTTAKREKFIPLALHYFFRQDYLRKELVIIDDGEKPVMHLIPDEPSIRYIRSEKNSLPIGTKRNHACENAKGDIIVHWDDDDWYAQDWISKQVATLLTTHADICGLSEAFFYAPSQNKSWKYVYPVKEKAWVTGATMAYRKEHWMEHPFEDIQIGEDNRFVWQSRGHIVKHDYIQGFVSFLHPGNTSPKHTQSNRWQPYDTEKIIKLLGNDMLMYKEIIQSK